MEKKLINDTVEKYNNPYKILFKNIKYLNNTEIYRNSPRNSSINSTFERFNSNFTFEKWPIYNKKDYNDNKDLCDCNFFISIISFEFDEDNNIYLLDEGNNNCPINIFIFNLSGYLISTNKIYEKKNQNISLNNFVIDKINNYFYIPFTNISNDNENEDKVGIFIKEINKNENLMSQPLILNNKKFLFEEKYNYEDIFEKYNYSNIFLGHTKNIINIALSCDGEYLLLSPLSSRMIYSILTKELRQSKGEISINDVKEAYKNDVSSTLISSNLGNLYLTGLEQNLIYMAGQINYDLSIFDFKILDKIGNNNNNYFPSHLSITNGELYISYISIITDNDTTVYTQIYTIPIDKEKSYIFKCGGLIYIWNWNAYIIWGLFCIIFGLILGFVYIGNKQDQDINKKNK